MTTQIEKLEVELEDLGGTSWWATLLTTLASQNGLAQLRFVGRVDGTTRYTGSAFSAPRTLGPMDPEESWAPGMTASFTQLCRELDEDGWAKTGQGREPWALTFERPTASSTLPQPSDTHRHRRPRA